MSQTPRRRMVFFVLVFLFWLIFDLLTKQYIFQLLPKEQQSITIVDGYLRLTHLKNKGAIWGILEGKNHLLYIFHLLVVPFLFLFFLWSIYRPGFLVDPVRSGFIIASGLIMGGAIGNLYDRVFFGFVRDFIDVTIPLIGYRWPVFNVADSGITVGATLLAYYIMLYPPEDEEEQCSDREDPEE